jgi:two-component system phosphate regulon sensor histidine kinase PhoR
MIISGDNDAIIEAIINLLSNAVKFSTKHKDIEITLQTKNGEAWISIKDRGIGIPEGELPHIFDKFYRTDESSAKNIAGTGIGLALVKHIMDSHQGRVEVSSKLNRGSIFSLIFQLRRETQ